MGDFLGLAVEKLRTMADIGISGLDRESTMNHQWLRLQNPDSPAFTKPVDHPPLTVHKPQSPDSKSMSYSDLIVRGNEILDGIMQTLKPRNTSYDMSDWEDEEPMKPMEFDPDETWFNGKEIPPWASGEQLARAVLRQRACDGDILFQNLSRRCNLVEVFGTKRFKYYDNRR